MYKIGNKILDKKSGKTETVLDITSNSILLTQTKLTDKGINCDNWFSILDKDFNKRFELTHPTNTKQVL
jgi:hypothetical protein